MLRFGLFFFFFFFHSSIKCAQVPKSVEIPLSQPSNSTKVYTHTSPNNTSHGIYGIICGTPYPKLMVKILVALFLVKNYILIKYGFMHWLRPIN